MYPSLSGHLILNVRVSGLIPGFFSTVNLQDCVFNQYACVCSACMF